jgi:hypothetical protein
MPCSLSSNGPRASRTALILLLLAAPPLFAGDWAPLAGQWRFALDPKNEGVTQKWFEGRLPGQIQLPGTTDEAQKGTRNDARETGRLTRVFPYEGAAWYQRDIEVPSAWATQRVVLVLERTKSSRLWVDGNAVGGQDSLVAPHRYALGALAPGPHQLTLRIDNAERPPIGDPHQISDQTQTNWNGIIGKIGLAITGVVWIEDVQVYPDFAARKVRVRVELGNETGQAAAGTLALSASVGSPVTVRFAAPGERAVTQATYTMGDEAKGWDEFTPTLYALAVSLEASAGGRRLDDRREVTFGLRDFSSRGGSQFHINGKTIFLRGRHDACVFPLTGYPPMTVEGWLRVFEIAKSYGLNHHRFHTWTPPEAAFEAADRLGIYLQPELPNWSGYGEPAHDDYLRAEGERLLRAFGNHPSFVMLSLGNELGGNQEARAAFVKHFRELDGRHLYAEGTNNWVPFVPPGDDYFASFQVRGKKVRGSFGSVDKPLGHVQTGPPSTLKDYSDAIAGVPVPVIGHEIGEYQTAPDFREVAKYTGVVRARNLEAFRERLEKQGMLDQADDFFRASGALAVRCYREDIEAALRTRGFGGFQLLDLQDFPGQGTALVGILDAFLDSKGLIEPARWREFCSETVPLLLMAKRTWTRGETFSAGAEVAHYGPSGIAGAVPTWTLREAGNGRWLASGRLPDARIAQGSVTSLGEIRIPLAVAPAPSKLRLDLALEGTAFKNSYDIWIYPDTVDTAPSQVVVSRSLGGALQALASGARVLLLPEPAKLTQSIEGMFASDFWNWGMFRSLAEERHMAVAPGTLGILCDPKHPALADFPTESHSDWQWFHLLQNSRALILDAMPAGYRPLVQVIDNYERAHKLGVVFEARVGPGRLLVSSIDLAGQSDKPEARQLMHSLLRYMNSSQFQPATEVDGALLGSIIR